MPLPPNLQLVLRHGPGGNFNHHRVVSTEAGFCLSSELFSDLMLETPDGMVGCHQTLLAPLSPLLSSILASYPPFPGMVHTVVLPIKADTVKSVLKVIYTGNVTLPSQEHVDQVLSGLKMFGIHLPGLQCYRAAGRAGHYSHIQGSNNNIEPPPFSPINQSSSHFHTSIMQLPTKPVAAMEDVKPALLPPPDSLHDQPASLDKLRVLLARQLLPLGIGESAQCNVKGCTMLVTLSTLAQHFKDHKEMDIRVFKCDECGKGFKQKKSLEIHRIEDHEKYLKNPLFSTENTAICHNNNDTDSSNKKKRRRVSFNDKVITKVVEAGPKAPLMCALVEAGPKTPLVCTLCQAPLSSEWYRPPRRHNCPRSIPSSGSSSSTSTNQPQCSICSTPVSSAWYLPPSRHGCSAVFATTSGQMATSTSKKRRVSTPASFGRIEEIKYSCEICGNTFSSLIELRSHYTASHYWDKIEAQFTRWGSRCYICLRDFKTPNNLVKHLGNFHTYVDQCLVRDNMKYISKENSIKLQSHECGFCGETMPTSGDLKNHLSYVHFKKELQREFPEDSSTNRKNRCDRCGRMFNSDPNRIRHIGSFHDQVLKYAKQLIIVTDDDAKLIPENSFGEGLDESGEPFKEDQLQVAQFLTDWEPLYVSKIPVSGATKTSTPSVGTTTREHREAEAGSCGNIVTPEQSALHTCPLTNCTRQCSNNTDLLVHLAMSHYMDELEKEYGTGAGMNSCRKCDKILPNNKLSLMKHMAVDHEVVMMYVKRDMALEADLEKAVDNMDLEAGDQNTT